MIPILYASNENAFQSQGIGALSDSVSCSVRTVLNGLFELTMEYPITGIHYNDIAISCIIKAVAEKNGTPQLFDIYRITKPIKGIVTIYAYHVSNRKQFIPVMPCHATTCSEAFLAIDSHCAVTNPFTLWTDKSTTANFAITTPASLGQVLGGMKGSILDTYVGEYEFDNFTIKFTNRRGQDRGVTLRYGKNITSIEQDESIAATITGICPFWADIDGNVVTLPEETVDSEYAANFPFKRTVIKDFSQAFDTQPTEAELRAVAEAYVQSNGIGIPSVGIDVSFEYLADYEEYKDMALIEEVRLGDTVHVYFEPLGIEATARVVQTDYNVLLDKYDQIRVGSTKSTLSATLNNVKETAIEAAAEAIGGATTDLEAALQAALDAFAGIDGGYIVINRNAVTGQPYEILAMDTDDITTAQNIVRLNSAGIAVSNTGYNGTFTVAATGSGIVANAITTGTLNATLIKAGILMSQEAQEGEDPNFYLNLITGVLKGKFSELTIEGNTVNQIANNVLNTFIGGQYAQDLEDLQAQIDGQIETYFENYIPTLNNSPASAWSTTTEKDNHLGDLFYVVDNPDHGGECYRFTYTNGQYAWTLVEDSAVANAIAIAQNAEAIAGAKKRVFTTTPVPPYDVGDLWVQGSLGDIKVCAVPKAEGGTFAQNDWVLASKYTDDSALQSWINQEFEDYKFWIEEQVDKKAQTWYQSTDPQTAWGDNTAKAEHVGDLWYDSGTTAHGQKYYRYANINGTYAWQEMTATPPDEVFDKIDGKAQIFISTPVPPYHVGDLWFNSSTSDIMTCINQRLTGSYVASDWQKRNKYTDDSSLNAFINGDFSQLVTQNNNKVAVFYDSGQPDPADARIGDLWIQTGDNQLHRFNGTTWVSIQDDAISDALQAAADAQSTADGKIMTYAQDNPPQNTAQNPLDVGDLWVDTNDNNRLYRWYGSGANQGWKVISDKSALEEWVANDFEDYKSALEYQLDQKAQTWYQSTDPANSWGDNTVRAEHVGDMWYDTSTGSHGGKTYRYALVNNSYTWQEMTSSPPSEVFDKIDGKAQIFINTPTTPYHVGDLWFNSTTSDIMTCVTQRLTGNYVASDWQKRNKYTDDTALQTWQSGAFQTYVTETATKINSKITVYYMNSYPSSSSYTLVTGDLLIHTGDGNKLYRWNGSSWIAVQDAGIASALTAAGTAQATADGKIVTFAQGTQPSAQESSVGDLWINTANNNAIYRYNGSLWQLYPDYYAINEFMTQTYNPFVASIQFELDGKASTYYQTTDPSTGWAITEPFKYGSIITFNSQCYTENNRDYVDVYYFDGDDNVYRVIRMTGSFGGRQIKIPATQIHFYWHSDSSVHYWGWKVDSIQAYKGSDYTAYTSTYSSLPGYTVEQVSVSRLESNHNYVANENRLFYVAMKHEHYGDMWYDSLNSTTYFFDGAGWNMQDIPSEVFDMIDGKATIYFSTPATPYYVNDLWFDGSVIRKCIAARSSGNYSLLDWEKAEEYVDSSQASSIATNVVSSYDAYLNQQAVFNKLTNNGSNQGIYLENGNLYINASMIHSGILSGIEIRATNGGTLGGWTIDSSGISSTVTQANNSSNRYRVTLHSPATSAPSTSKVLSFESSTNSGSSYSNNYELLGNGTMTAYGDSDSDARITVKRRTDSNTFASIAPNAYSVTGYSTVDQAYFLTNVRGADINMSNLSTQESISLSRLTGLTFSDSNHTIIGKFSPNSYGVMWATASLSDSNSRPSSQRYITQNSNYEWMINVYRLFGAPIKGVVNLIQRGGTAMGYYYWTNDGTTTNFYITVRRSDGGAFASGVEFEISALPA